MFKIIKINLLVFLGLLLFMELAGQLIFLVKNGGFLFNDVSVRNRHNLFQAHPYLSVALKKNVTQSFKGDKEYHVVKTTELGTRWTGAELADTTRIRIACIGGSTTFCTGVDDEVTWPALLQKKLGNRYAVINYGVPAYKSVEAIIQLALYVSEIKPDIVVLYKGANDFYNYHLENNYPDYFHHGEVLMPMALLGTPKYETEWQEVKRKSGFFYIIHNLEERIFGIPMPERHALPDGVVDSLYKRNLRSILALTSSMNARELMIGQVLNPFIKREEKPWSIRVQSDQILPMMDRMNGFAEAVCASDSTCMFLDFKNRVDWKPEYFWDDMHFTPEGNDAFAEALKQVILEQPVK